MLPEKSQGTVAAVGAGAQRQDGTVVVVSVKVGDKVMLLEYGERKVVLEDKGYFFFRDNDLLGMADS